MVGRDDRIFQRLPDVALQGLHVYRPFGQNDLGAKVVINDSVTDTQFVRDQLFDGNRAEIYETASGAVSLIRIILMSPLARMLEQQVTNSIMFKMLKLCLWFNLTVQVQTKNKFMI